MDDEMTQTDNAEAPLLEDEDQVKALAALAQNTRLKTFRLLSQAGEEGLVAGIISRDLSVPHNTLSTHLAILTRAGLISQIKEGRNIRYFVQQDKIRSLATSLLQDCSKVDSPQQGREFIPSTSEPIQLGDDQG
jgi:DNA-binding transcriptional ArsR family regulator